MSKRIPYWHCTFEGCNRTDCWMVGLLWPDGTKSFGSTHVCTRCRIRVEINELIEYHSRYTPSIGAPEGDPVVIFVRLRQPSPLQMTLGMIPISDDWIRRERKAGAA